MGIFKEQDAIKLPLQLLYYCGLHPRHNPVWGKFMSGSVVVTLIILGPLAAIKLANAHGDIDIMAPSFETLMSVYQVSFKLTFLVVYRKRLIQLLDIMDEFLPTSVVDDDEEVKGSVKFIERMSYYCCALYQNGGILLVIMFIMKTVVLQELPLLCWVPYDGATPYFEIIGALGMWLLFTAVLCVGGFDNFFCAAVFKVVVQLKILQKSIQRLSSYDTFNSKSGEEEHVENIKKCINHHVLIIRFCDEFSEICSFICLNQFLMCVITICMELYTITESEDIGAIMKSMSYIFQIQVELALFCVAPTVVEIECDNLCNVVYDIEWHLLRRKGLRQNVLFMLKRAQSPIVFSAGGFFNMNAEVYVSVMNTVISFYTLLKNAKERSVK